MTLRWRIGWNLDPLFLKRPLFPCSTASCVQFPLPGVGSTSYCVHFGRYPCTNTIILHTLASLLHRRGLSFRGQSFCRGIIDSPSDQHCYQHIEATARPAFRDDMPRLDAKMSTRFYIGKGALSSGKWACGRNSLRGGVNLICDLGFEPNFDLHLHIRRRNSKLGPNPKIALGRRMIRYGLAIVLFPTIFMRSRGLAASTCFDFG
jgi:hypothetical protein